MEIFGYSCTFLDISVSFLIGNIFNSRIGDGQLDEAPITFGDIPRIKEAFMSILIGQHHKRIRYPKQDEMEQSIEKG